MHIYTLFSFVAERLSGKARLDDILNESIGDQGQPNGNALWECMVYGIWHIWCTVAQLLPYWLSQNAHMTICVCVPRFIAIRCVASKLLCALICFCFSISLLPMHFARSSSFLQVLCVCV